MKKAGGGARSVEGRKVDFLFLFVNSSVITSKKQLSDAESWDGSIGGSSVEKYDCVQELLSKNLIF